MSHVVVLLYSAQLLWLLSASVQSLVLWLVCAMLLYFLIDNACKQDGVAIGLTLPIYAELWVAEIPTTKHTIITCSGVAEPDHHPQDTSAGGECIWSVSRLPQNTVLSLTRYSIVYSYCYCLSLTLHIGPARLNISLITKLYCTLYGAILEDTFVFCGHYHYMHCYCLLRIIVKYFVV